MTIDPQCEAIVAHRGNEGPSRCQHAAKHRHETGAGTSIRICHVHQKVLNHRMRLGSDEEKVAEWKAGT